MILGVILGVFLTLFLMCLGLCSSCAFYIANAGHVYELGVKYVLFGDELCQESVGIRVDNLREI